MNSILWIFVDSLSGVLFLGTGYLLWGFLREKVPQALLIPDGVIFERYSEDVRKNKLWILPLKVFSGEIQYGEFFRQYSAKILYRIHISLLRMDNRIFATYNKVRSPGDTTEDTEVPTESSQ
jgi:hypothetical protein